MIKIYFDGSCAPFNPCGHAHAGALIFYGKKKKEISLCIGDGEGMSNNVAEYGAVIYALEWLMTKNLCKEEIEIFGDSLMVVTQLNKFIKNKYTKFPTFNGLYAPYAYHCIKIVHNFENINFTWIPRENNAQADALSRCLKRQGRSNLLSPSKRESVELKAINAK